MDPAPGNWRNIENLAPRTLTCGHCGREGSFNQSYACIDGQGRPLHMAYRCHSCNRLNYIDPNQQQHPGPPYGKAVEHIPKEQEAVSKIYDEARKCFSVGAHTAAVLSCRKLLMHVAVSLGAKERLNFTDYVQYFLDNHHVPPNSKDWVDHIRNKGNEANHRVVIMDTTDSKELIDFCEMLLKIIYEYPARGRAATAKPTP